MTTSADPIAEGAGLELLADGMGWTEGPLWLPGQQKLIWSDIINNRIMAWSAAGRELSVFADEVEYTNEEIGRASCRERV